MNHQTTSTPRPAFKILFGLAHIFLVGAGFLGLQILFQYLNHGVRATDWQQNIELLLLDRLQYAICFGLGGWLLFAWLLPRLLMPGQTSLNSMPLFRLTRKSTALSQLRMALIGITAGLLLLGLLWLQLHWITPSSGKTANLAILLANNRPLLLTHLLTTGLLTAILEEFFYRGCLAGYLERVIRLITSFNLSKEATLKSSQDIDVQKSPLRGRAVLILFVPVILFALVHPPAARGFMLVAGGLFTILFWRMGLLPAILAHSTYNTMLLLIGSW